MSIFSTAVITVNMFQPQKQHISWRSRFFAP